PREPFARFLCIDGPLCLPRTPPDAHSIYDSIVFGQPSRSVARQSWRPRVDPLRCARAMAEIGVYLPQVGFSWEELRARAIECDELGISSLWLMDHLYPPGMPQVPSFEAWTTATALATATERIRIGHLVLCNSFRHPALLAKMAI